MSERKIVLQLEMARIAVIAFCVGLFIGLALGAWAWF